jgi:hypothetical protein
MKAKRRGNELNIIDLERYGRTLLLDGVCWAKLVAGMSIPGENHATPLRIVP